MNKLDVVGCQLFFKCTLVIFNLLGTQLVQGSKKLFVFSGFTREAKHKDISSASSPRLLWDFHCLTSAMNSSQKVWNPLSITNLLWCSPSNPPPTTNWLNLCLRAVKSVTWKRYKLQFISVQFSRSVLSDSLQPHRLQHARLPCPSPTPQIHVHRVGDATPPSHPLLSSSPPAFNLSQHQIFSKESVLCIRWPKYWSFSFSSSPSNEYSGLISFRIDWFDLLAVQGTLKSLLKHHSLKASILHLPPNYLDNIPWLFIFVTRLLCPWGFSRQKY